MDWKLVQYQSLIEVGDDAESREHEIHILRSYLHEIYILRSYLQVYTTVFLCLMVVVYNMK